MTPSVVLSFNKPLAVRSWSIPYLLKIHLYLELFENILVTRYLYVLVWVTGGVDDWKKTFLFVHLCFGDHWSFFRLFYSKSFQRRFLVLNLAGLLLRSFHSNIVIIIRVMLNNLLRPGINVRSRLPHKILAWNNKLLPPMIDPFSRRYVHVMVVIVSIFLIVIIILTRPLAVNWPFVWVYWNLKNSVLVVPHWSDSAFPGFLLLFPHLLMDSCTP